MGCGASTPAAGAATVLRRVEEEGKEAVETVGDGLKTAASGVANGAKAGAGKAKGAAQDAAQDAAKFASHVADDVEEGLASLAFSRDKPVTCKVFVGDSGKGTFEFPELGAGAFAMPALQAKPDFGVCMSGGGMRAATCALGVTRALYGQGLLHQARYLATTSGASWFNSVLGFAQLSSLDDFLGPYVPPSTLTPAELQKVGERGVSFMATIANSASMQRFAKQVVEGLLDDKWWQNRSGAWTKAIADVFLEPFGLGDLANTTVTAVGTKGAVHKRIVEAAAAMGLVTFKHQDVQQLPFPIMTSNVLQPNDSRIFFTGEWTPLYAGMPAALTDEQGRKWGGGMVEPIGLNSEVVQRPEGEVGPDGADVSLRSVGPSSLGDAAGISSAYIPYKLAKGKDLAGKALNLALGGMGQQYWSPQDYEAQYTQMSDGGGTDYTAITCLLRRKVKKVLCWVSTSINPDDLATFIAGDGVSQMFGRFPGTGSDKPDAMIQNKVQQVFPAEAYEALWKDAHTRFQSGGPVWHRAQLPVMQNDFQGVQGGWSVDMMFVWNCLCSNFNEQLPEDTLTLMQQQKQAAEKKKLSGVLGPFVPADLAEFPNVSTTRMNYSNELVVALSNMAAWNIHSVSGEIHQMLAA